MSSGPASDGQPPVRPAGGLAARCPACATVFRVVPDQLRVSEGWVRCGRCADVFNASVNLVDIATGAPVAAGEAPPPAPALRHEDEAARDDADDAVDDGQSVAVPLPIDSPAQEPAPVDGQASDGPTSNGPTSDSQASDSRASVIPAPKSSSLPSPASDSRPSDSQPFDSEAFDIERAASAAEGVDAPPGAPAAAAATPSFLRRAERAERAERWQRPRVRALLAVLGLLGLLVLAGQWLYAYRDPLAARFAAARPLLEEGCALLGCSIGAARSIESLTVDSSGLVRVEKSNVYRLSVVLKNRASIDVALPAIDLILTDGQGRLLARRVFRAEELGAAQTTLGARRDLSLQATVQTATEAVAGYTIDIFYP